MISTATSQAALAAAATTITKSSLKRFGFEFVSVLLSDRKRNQRYRIPMPWNHILGIIFVTVTAMTVDIYG